MLLMAEGIRGGKCHSFYRHGDRICHSSYRYAIANKKYMKDYNKIKESSYLQYWDVNNPYGWAMSQKLPVNSFEWTKDTSQFNENFIKNYNDKSNEGYFLEVDVPHLTNLKNYMNIIMIYCCYQKE